MRASRPTKRNDRGFTLPEVLITTVIIALVAVVIAAVFTVIVRTRPTAEARVDDARSLLGLTTWFPGDVNSTPVQAASLPTLGDWWNNDPSATSSCLGAPAGTNLMRLRWQETNGATTTYEAGYRYVDAGGWRIQRVYCREGGTAEVVNLTAELPDPLTMPPTSGFQIRPVDGVNSVVGAWIEVTTIEGEQLRVDAVSESPNETLPPPPTAVTTSSTTPTTVGTNSVPFAADIDITLQLGASITVGLPAADADGPNPVSYQSDTNTDARITVTPDVLPLEITISSNGTGMDGDLISFSYNVSDGLDTGTGTINVRLSLAGPSGTTTTTTTTTTTLPPPCAATTLTVTPPSVRNQKTNGNDTNSGQLSTQVLVTVGGLSGNCSGLQLRFSFEDDPYPSNKEQSILFGGSVTITFEPLGTERWDDGNHTLTLFDAVAGTVISPSAILVVT